MNARVPSTIKNYLAIALLGIVALLTLNNALFVHWHTLPNGNIVVHSHPFSEPLQSDGSQGHQHSKIEFNFLDSLLLLFAVGLIAFALKALLFAEIHFTNYSPTFLSLSPLSLTNKAPPVCF